MIWMMILGVLVNWLLLYHELGMGAFLSVVAVLAYIGLDAYKEGRLDLGWWIKTLVTLCFALTFILRDMAVFKVLTFMAMPFIVAFFYMEICEWNFLKYLLILVKTTFRPFLKLHLFIRKMMDGLFRGREEMKHAVLGILVAIPFLAVVLPLLISSDLILEDMTVNFIESFEISGKMIFRIVFWGFFCSYLYAHGAFPLAGLMQGKPLDGKGNVRDREKQDSEDEMSQEQVYVDTVNKEEIVVESMRSMKGAGSASVMVNTFLSVINIVYGMYVFIQIYYLFMNRGRLPEGITYAEYAREGFFQLLAVAVINVLLVVILELMNRKEAVTQRVLESLTLTMTIVMSVSAFYRMTMYEATYGYTRLRLLVFVFLIFLMVLMVMIIAYLVTRRTGIVTAISVYMMVFYIAASWFNMDGFVADRNILRYENTGEIDLYYLTGLSRDAKTSVDAFFKEYPDLKSPEFGSRMSHRNEDDFSWQSWNVEK